MRPAHNAHQRDDHDTCAPDRTRHDTCTQREVSMDSCNIGGQQSVAGPFGPHRRDGGRERKGLRRQIAWEKIAKISPSLNSSSSKLSGAKSKSARAVRCVGAARGTDPAGQVERGEGGGREEGGHRRETDLHSGCRRDSLRGNLLKIGDRPVDVGPVPGGLICESVQIVFLRGEVGTGRVVFGRAHAAAGWWGTDRSTSRASTSPPRVHGDARKYSKGIASVHTVLSRATAGEIREWPTCFPFSPTWCK